LQHKTQSLRQRQNRDFCAKPRTDSHTLRLRKVRLEIQIPQQRTALHIDSCIIGLRFVFAKDGGVMKKII
jgi:hypothetical protein